MNIDATFWVAISFFIFCGVLIYLKVPQKINNSLTDQINKMKEELDEAEKLKIEAKNLLSNYENKIDKSKKETKEIIDSAKKESENLIIEMNDKFHKSSEIKKNLEENKIILEHFLNKIDDEGYALDPETNEPIKCDSQNKRVSNEVFKGISAKQLGILITEERNDLITRFDHALYLGRELQKAEECLYKKLPYIQD